MSARSFEDAASEQPEADGGASIDVGSFLDGSNSPDSQAHDAMILDGGASDAGQQSPAGPNPAQAGTHQWTELNDVVNRGNRRTPVVIYVPNGTQPRASILFLPGFQLESHRYTPLMEHLVSHGFIVIRADPPDPLFGVNHLEMSGDAQAVIDWTLDAQRSFSSVIDSSKVGIIGHSLGGKISSMVAHRDARVTALFGIDPVNGGHPQQGYSNELPDILPDELQSLSIPIGLVGETTDDGSLGGTQACAPADVNYSHFYDAAIQSSWTAEWTIEGADHMDFVDDTSLCLSCGFCQDGSADKIQVLSQLRALSVAFFKLHHYQDVTMTPWLTGALVDSSIRLRHRP